MGIPKFFRWLTRRYPLILKNISREEDSPPIDNLYLDLNSIVHNCIHGNDAKLHERVSKLTDFDEVWANIMKAIDEIVHTVKPQKLIFLAVDGVAPRAKMNQQRARRFRSAKDSSMLKEKLIKEGKEAPNLFDSNAISPGTKFMFDLNKQLEFFVQYKLNTDTLYQNLEVVLSDSSVPGEGEHKMMDFIRQAKTHADYDPNTRHCFYGSDADLIMLSLLTHEPNFMIIREEHVVRKIKQGGVQRLDIQKTFNFQLIFISLLREYFQLEYSVLATQMRMRFDIERIIDDFVFFCFFIGNDFLPSLSALDISEGSLDNLIDLYKQHLPQMNDYITESGKIYWDRAEPFIQMLGNHELESFKMRVKSIKQARQDRIVSFQSDFGVVSTEVDRKTLIKNKIREKLNEKKTLKIFHLKQKNRDKTFKRYMLMKKFDEDEEGAQLSKRQKEIKAELIEKYRKVLQKQHESPQTQSEGDKTEAIEEKKYETLKDIVAGIKDEYFSDLNINDIADHEVSDVDESEINLDSIPSSESNNEIKNKIQVQEEIIDKYSEANLQFMNKFISMFSDDPVGAKAFYYSEKLKVDVKTEQGVQFKKRMLMKYLEGLQWVLFYYYRGAQHWRWYYPYHYAPMISDIDENIVQNFLSGKITIEQFEIDVNCSEVNVPYTPFQQLLSIMPTKSIGLLPDSYASIATGELKEYFPEDFDIDLNGRALPWEAACLIPFVDESKAIELEAQMLLSYPLSEDDKRRNQVYFYFKKFTYNRSDHQGVPLQSSLKSIKSIDQSYVTVQLLYDYQDVGKHSFLPKLLPGVKLPCVDFPSFKWIGVNSVGYDEKVVQEVAFQRVLVKIPQCFEDTENGDLEAFVHKFVKQPQIELYIGLPYQIEAFPVIFENENFSYTVYGDVYTNIYQVHKDTQQMNKDQFTQFQSRQLYKLQEQGFLVENPRAFVSLSPVKEVRYDNKAHQFYKVYEKDTIMLPLCIVMRKRDNDHFMNMNLRCNSLIKSFKPGKKVICLNMQLFGVMGEVSEIDSNRGIVKVKFDRLREELKIHDPFFGQTVLQDEHVHKEFSTKRYYSDSQIETNLKLGKGIINKITGSFLVTFNDRVKLERQVVDLGLNIKNFTKKVHIPDFVRFVADPESIADYQYDDYTHNQHARGARHIRKHWEYSEECFNILKEYMEKFKDVFTGIIKGMKINKQMLSLKDMFGPKVDEYAQGMRLKQVTDWIEQLPLSRLPYVEMGFDALNEDLINKLNIQSEIIKEKFQSIKLKCREIEYLQPNFLYQECFPYWCQPFSDKTVEEYHVGDRVLNINSTKREFVPFGLRGTVVGHTNDKVIVLFDEQYLGGNNIYGHCEDFRGGYLNPNFLINLTHKFTQILKKNPSLVETFQEQAASGTPEAEAQLLQREALLLTYQQQQQYQDKPKHRNEFVQQQKQQQEQNQKQQNYQQKQKKPREEKKQQEEKKSQDQYRPKLGQHREVKYVAKIEESKVITSQQQVMVNNQDVEEENAEAYQDLKALIVSMQSQSSKDEGPATQQIDSGLIQVTKSNESQKSEVLVVTESSERQKFDQIPVLKTSESQKSSHQYQADEVLDEDEEEEEGDEQVQEMPPIQIQIDPSFGLQSNPDFMNLLNMMNSMATQLQNPIFVLNEPPVSNLNVNVPEFKPTPKKQEKDEESKEK